MAIGMRSMLGAAAMLGALAAGCAMTSSRKQITEDAHGVLECPEASLRIEPIERNDYLVEGCGRRAHYTCGRTQIGTHACRMAHGTQPFTVVARVQEKAAALLGCAREEVAVEQLTTRDYRARGNGRAVDYECSAQVDCCVLGQPGVFIEDAVNESAEMKARSQEPAVQGSLSKEIIRRRITQSIGTVRKCYETTLKGSHATPKLTGVVALQFIIGPDGSVKKSAVARSSLGDEGAERCIADAISALQFPPPRGGGIVVVTYPFVLRTTSPWAICQ